MVRDARHFSAAILKWHPERLSGEGMQRPAHQTYIFEEFQLDLTRGTLYRGNQEIKLRPKSFDVLRYLTENPGRLVGKDELIESVWQGMAVTDDSVVQCLKDIRRALEDKDQTFIRTVPRRGYIFEKQVCENGRVTYAEETEGFQLVIEETLTDVRSDEPSAIRSVSSAVKLLDGIRRRRGVAVAAFALLLTVIAGLALYNRLLSWWFKPPTIAVLPIANATGDRGQDYISDGLTESIITSLASLNVPGKPRVRVLAANTMLMFKGKNFDAPNVGRDLGADSVLVSKMFFQGGLRIFSFELISAADGSVIWREQYAVEPNSPIMLLETQDKVPNNVAEHLQINVSDSDRAKLTRRYTQNPEAYDLFLKGRSEFRRTTPSAVRQSIEYYKRALNLDQEFATAHWAMGLAYQVLGTIDEIPDKEATARAVDSFQAAIKIDSNFLPAQNALKKTEGDHWNWKSIETEGPTHPAWGDYLYAHQRFDEQIEIEKQKLRSAPYHPVLNLGHASTLLAARRFDEAIAQCAKSLNLVPTSDKAYVGPETPWLHLYFAIAYSEKRMFDEAVKEAQKAIELGEGSGTLNAELAVVYAKAGRRNDAFKVLDELKSRESTGEYAPALNIGLAYCALGEKEQAFTWLERAYNERENRLPWIRARSDCDWLHSDTRFSDLIRRMGLEP